MTVTEHTERVILHSDLNAFYASVEMVLHPELAGRAVAVCGSTEDRHGIVLAKSELAKRAGVTTGMINAEALARCPGLIIISPHHEEYSRFSRLARGIYERYTDLIEPFGMDECWLDVTGSTRLFGDGMTIANRIREDMKRELGLTVSVGVSFNKVFAKLGSDLKKPDAVTVVSKENYKQLVFPLPVSDLLFVGHVTAKKLHSWGIHTIGDLAGTSPDTLRELLGVNGLMLWNYANGNDASPVTPSDFEKEQKSVSHGVTCSSDLLERDMVWRVILGLTQEVGGRLREQKQAAYGISLYVKYADLSGKQFTERFREPTQSPLQLARAAQDLFDRNRCLARPVRAITVGAAPLCPEDQPFQPDLFRDNEKFERAERVDDTVDTLRRRFGTKSVLPATLLMKAPVAEHSEHEATLPEKKEI